MRQDADVVNRLREALGAEPELLPMLQRLVTLANFIHYNVALGSNEPVIQQEMEQIGGDDRTKVVGLLPEVVLLRSLRFIGDKNNLAVDSGMTQACRAARLSAQSLANGVTTVITFDDELFDTNDMHDNVVDNSRIIFKERGIYIVGGAVIFDVSGVGDREIQLLINGTSIHTRSFTKPSAGIVTSLQISMLFLADKDDYAELRAYQDSGAPLNVNRTGPRSPNFWAHRLS